MLSASLFILPAAHAQDVHFSQFYESAPMRNPALTGIFTGDYKVAFNYRNQWSSFATPFQTGMVSAETKALMQANTGDFMSFGLTAVYDKAGSIDFASTAAYGAVNYNKALGASHHTYLSGGFTGGYTQRSLNPAKMRFANQFTGGAYNAASATGESISTTTISHFDLGAGLSLSGATGRHANFYIGAAAYHISQPRETYWGSELVRLTTRWSGNAGLYAAIGDRLGLALHVNYQYQAPYEELIGGGLLSYRAQKQDDGKPVVVSAGCFYRLDDAVIPTIKLDYHKWAATFSYDVAMGASRPHLSGAGGWEITTLLRGSYKRRQQPTGCPQFELLDGVEGL